MNDVEPEKRRSATSNYTSVDALVGHTAIPSELGTTVTGAIANLNNKSSGGEWEYICMGTGVFDLVYDKYVELACSLVYDNGVSYRETLNTFTLPVIAISSDNSPYDGPKEQVIIHSNSSGYGTRFTFDIPNNKVNIAYIVNNSSKGAVYGKLK